MAYLAALPKAPNNYHPVRKYDAAVSRRDWVILQMFENGFVTQAQADQAKLEPLEMKKRDPTQFVEAEYFAEEVRRRLYDRYGEKGLYKGGLSVHTTVDPALQAYADHALREGLAAYDQRHGWRGPLANIEPEVDWRTWLAEFPRPTAAPSWQVAVVLAVADNAADIGFVDGSTGAIPLDAVTWARPQLEDRALGPKVGRVGDVLTPGDVVLVEAITEPTNEEETVPQNSFALKQIPDVGGALIVLDPHNGRVLAMSGGFDFGESQFNRATQAKRQPGSSFKPFVYLAALDAGYTPASVVLDAPFVLDQGEGLGKWKPENYSQKFYGPSTLRLGLEKSRNLMTVRVAQSVGFGEISGYAKRFGISPDLPPLASMALGAGETTLIRMASAYGMLVNGGHYIEPAFVERVQDRHGSTIYRRDTRACDGCAAEGWNQVAPPALPDGRAIVADPRTAYQVVSMLEGVVQRGTGRTLRELGKPIGGKTGTTNDFNDAWFIGFTPDLVVGTYVGFDQPASLGRRESGGRVAAPIVKAFFKDALAEKTAVPFRVPPGIRFVRIDATSGLPATAGTDGSIVEAFLPGTEPTAPARAALQADGGPADAVPLEGVGGLY
jgi:penicillin-binding protein 1A